MLRNKLIASLFALCLTFGVAATSHAQAALDMFLEIPGIPGESKIQQGAIDLVDYNMNLMAPRDSASGLATGKRQHKPMTFIVNAEAVGDSSAPQLFKACAQGQHIKEAKLTCRKSGGGSEQYLKVTMKDCIISSYQTSGNSGENPLFEASSQLVITPFTSVTIESAMPGAEPVTFTYDLKAAKK